MTESPKNPYQHLIANALAQKPQTPAVSNLDIGAILDSISKNPRNRVYKNQNIYLDGYTFTNCVFSNCRLYSDTGIFALKSCIIMNDCQPIYGPSALRIIKLFNLQFHNPNATYPIYNVVDEGHGSITLE